MSDLNDFVVHDDSMDMELDSDENADSMSSLSFNSAANSGTNKINFVCRFLFLFN